MPEKLCLVVDVLGFQQIMRNVPEETRIKRLEDWMWLAAKPRALGLESQLVSDTLFAIAEPDEDGLAQLAELSTTLLEQGLNRNLPLRGAIAQGQVEWASQSLWGPAIVDAYTLGQMTDWLGVACAPSVTAFPPELYEHQLVAYPTPLKSGDIRINTNVRWTIPNATELGRLTTGGFLTKPAEVLGWSWHRKLENTSDFRSYLQVLAAAGQSPQQFLGDVGPHLVALFVEWAIEEVGDKWRLQFEKWYREGAS